MKRVLFLTYYASPYRVNFFELLGRELDVTVLLSDSPDEAVHRDESWFGRTASGFHRCSFKRPPDSAKSVCAWRSCPG